jgi:hypothetical protein
MRLEVKPEPRSRAPATIDPNHQKIGKLVFDPAWATPKPPRGGREGRLRIAIGRGRIAG